MTKENLALALGSIWVSTNFWFSQLVVGLDVDMGTLLKVTKVVVGTRSKGQNCVPRGLCLGPRWRTSLSGINNDW